MGKEQVEDEIRKVVGEELAKIPKEKEGTMTTTRDFCPECMRKDNEKALADRDHRDTLKEKDNQVNQLTQAVEQLRGGHSHFDPSTIEGCPNCGPALKDYVKGKVDQAIAGITASKEDATKIARAAGLELMPDKIVIGPNLRKRLQGGVNDGG